MRKATDLTDEELDAQLALHANNSKSNNVSQLTDEELDRQLAEHAKSSGTGQEDSLLNVIPAMQKVLGQGVKDFASGALNPLASLIASPYNIPKNLSAKAQGKNYKPFLFGLPTAEEAVFPEAYRAGNIAGLLTPGGTIGKAVGLPQKLLEAGNIPEKLFQKGLSYLSRSKSSNFPQYGAEVLGNALKGAGAGAAYASGEENGDVGQSAALGGAVGGALHLPFRLPSAALNEYISYLQKKSRKPGSELRTPEEVRDINSAIGDLPVDLGTLINEPALRSAYKDWIGNMIGSNSINKSQEVVNALHGKGQSILDKFLGDTKPTEVGETLREFVKGDKKSLKEANTKDWQNLSKMANERGFLVNERPYSEKFAKDYFSQKQRALNTKTEFKLPEEAEEFLKDQLTPPLEFPTLNEFDEARKKLRKKARGANKKGDDFLGAFYNEAATIAQQDLVHNLEKSGHSDLVSLFNKSRPGYIENVLPYKEPSIKNIIKGKFPATKIAPELLLEKNNKVFSNLPERAKQNVLYDLFEKGATFSPEGKPIANIPSMLNTFNKKLPVEERQRLLSDAEKKSFEDLQKLNDVSGTSKLILNAPNTGYYFQKRAAEGLPLLLGLGAGSLLGSEHMPAPLAAALGIASAFPIARKVSNSLTNQNKLRKYYMNEEKIQPSKLNKYTEGSLRNLISYYLANS